MSNRVELTLLRWPMHGTVLRPFLSAHSDLTL